MPEEIKENKETVVSGSEGTANDTSKYIDAIKDLKSNSVSREEYNKLQAENSELLKSLVNDRPVVEPVGDKEQREHMDEVYKKMFQDRTDNMSNLEYITHALEIREDQLAKGNDDPFEFCNETVNKAYNVDGEAVAEGLKAMVQEANGDPVMFDAIYKRSVIPTKHLTKK